MGLKETQDLHYLEQVDSFCLDGTFFGGRSGMTRPKPSAGPNVTVSEMRECLEDLESVYRYTHCGLVPPLCFFEKIQAFFNEKKATCGMDLNEEAVHASLDTNIEHGNERRPRVVSSYGGTLTRCNVLLLLLRGVLSQGVSKPAGDEKSPTLSSNNLKIIKNLTEFQRYHLNDLQWRLGHKVSRYSPCTVRSDTAFPTSLNEGSATTLRNRLVQGWRKHIEETPSPHQVQRLRLRRTCALLVRHRGILCEKWLCRQTQLETLAHEAVKKYEMIRIKQKQQEQKEKMQRMQYLKEHDLDKYWDTVKQSKNARISEILTRMKTFIDTINCQMKLQQKVTFSASQKQLSVRQGQAPGDMDGPSSISGSVRQPEKQPSSLVGGELMPYQLSGLKFLVKLYDDGLSGILADDMGLGKTVQAIAFIAFLKEHRRCLGPHLVIVPLSTLPNWLDEFHRWCPSLDILEFRGHHHARRSLSRRLRQYKFHVCVTTYDWVLRARSLLSSLYWGLMIVDEGHRLKNIRSKFHIALAGFHSTHRVLLTGTPLQNNLSELWSLLNFLLPNIFSSFIDFEMWFEEPFKNLYPSEKHGVESAFTLNEEEKLVIINSLHSIIRPFLLRRVKEDVLDELPQKKECLIWVPLSPWQKLAYQCISDQASRLCESANAKRTNRTFRNIMIQLRKVVNHPYLFEEEYGLDENLYRVSGKFEVLDRMLPKLLHFKHKTLIFCQMTQIMDLLDDYFEFKGYSRCRLDGTTLVEERRQRVEKFNDPTSSVFIFTLSTRAGGLGLNLQAADTVIIFDSDWNPHQDLQAQARAHRYGQTKEVFVFRLITVSNVEETVLLRARHKLDMDQKIIQAGMFDNTYTEQERQTKLREFLYPKGPATEQSITSPEELNHLLARNHTELEFFQKYDRQLFSPEAMNRYVDHRPPPFSVPKTQEEPPFSLLNLNTEMYRPMNVSEKSPESQQNGLVVKDDTPQETSLAIHEESLESKEPWAQRDDFMACSVSPSTSSFFEPQLCENVVQEMNCPGEDKGETHRSEMMTTEDLLIQCGRLVNESEISSKCFLVDLEKESKATKVQTESGDEEQFPRGGRPLLRKESRESFITLSLDTLSEAAFNRALRRLESGEAPDFDIALTIEKTRLNKRRRQTCHHPSTRSMEDSEASTIQPLSKEDPPSSPSQMHSCC